MLYIVKNERVTHETNSYIFFDSNEKTKAYSTMTPENAKKLAEMVKIEPISPLNAREMYDFREIELSELIPLPF